MSENEPDNKASGRSEVREDGINYDASPGSAVGRARWTTRCSTRWTLEPMALVQAVLRPPKG